MNHMTQEQVAAIQGCTATAIRAVEKRALRKIKAAIEQKAAAKGVSPREWLIS